MILRVIALPFLIAAMIIGLTLGVILAVFGWILETLASIGRAVTGKQ